VKVYSGVAEIAAIALSLRPAVDRPLQFDVR
jgi:hypothetical protein